MVPPRVEYSLPYLGQTLNTALLPLGDWADANRDQILENAGKAKDPA